eukprot:2310626-Amphidinium_carterae.1
MGHAQRDLGTVVLFTEPSAWSINDTSSTVLLRLPWRTNAAEWGPHSGHKRSANGPRAAEL